MLEIVAAATAVLYLLLITRRSWIAWPVYVASSLMYAPVFWSARLYGDAALQIYFVSVGLYAWRRWSGAEGAIAIKRLGFGSHLWTVGWWLVTAAVLGLFLSSTPAGVLGYGDAFVTIGSIVATVLTARGVLENWLYWVAINGVATLTFGIRGLGVTAILYGLYTALALRGFYAWRRAETS
jgi:nicotinamide mononucleotide transporter